MAKRTKKVDEAELKALLAAEIRDAENFSSSEEMTERVRALNYYNGIMPDTPHQEGWSSFKSRDVADVIGWVLPGIIRVFSASDRMVDYEPERPGDEQFCDQASDYANYVFWRDNDGYRILWDATHDSLLLADGIVKTWWDDSEECEYAVRTGLTDQDIAILLEDGDIEIIASKAGEPLLQNVEQIDPLSGQPVSMQVEVPTYDIKTKRVTSRGRIRIQSIEPENFLKDRESISIADARFVAHRDPFMTRSRLVEMGFDKDVVEALPRYNWSYARMSEEATARDAWQIGSAQGDKSTDRIEFYECYIKADVNGDGIAETVLAYYAGAEGAGELLDWEIWDDETPFDQIPCEPVPHRFTSRSLAGEVMDVQQIKTTIFRQLLNNTYQVNNPQKVVETGSIINMDELVNPTIGGTLLKKTNSAPIQYNVVPSIMQEALGALGTMDQVVEMRTGVSRATMALDPETLQNQTATANNNARDAAYSQIELIARNQAELGWKKVFGKILRLIVKHQDQPRTIRLRDEWVVVDPREWNAAMDATINVGLGTGSRDRDMAMLNTVLNQQIAMTDRFMAGGMSDMAIDMLPRIRRTLVKIIEAAGIKMADSYYPDIKIQDLPAIKQMVAQMQSQPDPKVQAEMQKMQTELQFKQVDMQMQAQKQQSGAELKREQITTDAELKKYQIDSELMLKREQLAAELQLKREQMAAELELKAQMGVLGAQTKVATSKVEIGGEPG
ncbi:MAG: hypothetical protein JSR13_05975 [Proteobacteria bacterium]|nr:hypothetical protein [Pseudomonadota bacterium]